MTERIPAYDQEVVDRLVRREGYSEGQAVRIASTEMEGVGEGRSGIVHGRQTHCEVLRGDGSRLPTRGVEEGRQKTKKEAAEYLDLDQDATDHEIDKAVHFKYLR